MYRLLSLVLLLGVLLSACDAEVTRMPAVGEDEVLQAQANRFQAMIDVDIDSLDTLLADDMTYTHSTGQLDRKAGFLDSLQSRKVQYVSIEPTDMRARMYDDAAVITGITAVHVRVGEQDLAATLRITEVHLINDRRWQLVAYQSTRLPSE